MVVVLEACTAGKEKEKAKERVKAKDMLLTDR
jgi:hypothetical protein